MALSSKIMRTFASVIYAIMKFHALLLVLLVSVLSVVSCGSLGKKESVSTDEADSTTSTIHIDSTQLPSANVDNLFNDFLYEFMNNATFQLTRVKFPLTYGSNTLTMSTWKHDSLFANEHYYIVLCAHEQDVLLEKSTDIQEASVYWTDASRRLVRHYRFQRNDQKQWMLTLLQDETLEQVDDDSFYTFYNRFATDEAFQQVHVAPEVKLTYFNEETQGVEKGFITAQQWKMQRPELPTQNFATIHYGQSVLSGAHRFLMIRGLSNGLSITITFERRGKAWQVVGLDS